MHRFWRSGLAALSFGLLCLVVLLEQASAQTPPTPPPDTPGASRSDGSTSDYLPDSLRLLFPSAPASLVLTDTQVPIFPSGTPGYDLLAFGVLSSTTNSATPLTKTLTLELGGGIRGRIFANPPWLLALPDRFINPQGPGKLEVVISVRQDAGQGAGLLPGQTNWGSLKLALNGALFEYAVPLIVGAPPRVGRDEGDQVFALYRLITQKMDAQGDLDLFIGTPRFPNAAQVALGLAVDYLGENEYNQRLSQSDFSGRVAETLAQKDYNADGWLGFKPEDIRLGAPGWALGKKAN